MIKLGITGNIACGKSLVASMLEGYGCPVIDSDLVVHQLLKADPEVIDQIFKLIGKPRIMSDDGRSVDRRKLGELVFRDTLLKSEVENIIHPKVARATGLFFREHQAEPVCANLIPLLFETGSDGRFDLVWLVYCDPVIQRRRLELRNPELSEEMIALRLSAQMPQTEKYKRVSLVIDNSGDMETTTKQVLQAWQNLIKHSGPC